MRILKPGHRYQLQNLKAGTTSVLQFHQDGAIHGGRTLDGPSTQEVLRACADRVKHLESEKHWPRNAELLAHLRASILLFEIRALEIKVERGLEIETLPVDEDGHISWREPCLPESP